MIELGDMEHIREEYRAHFSSVFNWSKLYSTYSSSKHYLTIGNLNSDTR